MYFGLISIFFIFGYLFFLSKVFKKFFKSGLDSLEFISFLFFKILFKTLRIFVSFFAEIKSKFIVRYLL